MDLSKFIRVQKIDSTGDATHQELFESLMAWFEELHGKVDILSRVDGEVEARDRAPEVVVPEISDDNPDLLILYIFPDESLKDDSARIALGFDSSSRDERQECYVIYDEDKRAWEINLLFDGDSQYPMIFVAR